MGSRTNPRANFQRSLDTATSIDAEREPGIFGIIIQKTLQFALLAAAFGFSLPAAAWQMKQAPLMTDFAQQVDTNSPLAEYPRPQMVRSNWLSLNGIWQFQPGNTNDPVPINQTLTNQILVPFPMESAISGVKQYFPWSWYRRTFTAPPAWSGQRILLHLDAVTWQSQVFINGASVGVHKGGYDPSTYDITPFLAGGTQELIVQVYSPQDSGSQARGKQTLYPGGIMYTSSSGIWQTVWLEPVPATSLGALHLVPDIDSQLLRVTAAITGPTNGVTVNAVARLGSNQVGAVSGPPGTVLSVPVPSSVLWSPTNPVLYDLTVTLSNGPAMLDAVNSYFGMRKISLATNGTHVQMLLNNQFLFQFGPLDQGFWPDGIYTAPTDYALKTELERTRALGFNMIRKHIKVEPARWYYWADKLGVLVWQDMPSGNSYTGNPNPPAVDPLQFIGELTAMVTNHWNSPAVIMWVTFNEGQGQAGSGNGVGQTNTAYLVQLVKSLDPSRLVNQASGGNFAGVGDILDGHYYPAPGVPGSSTQVPVCGEYGGIALTITNHIWAPGFGYIYAVDGNDLTSQFENYAGMLCGFEQNNGLNAAVYTQITDVETELNGLYTYDRKVRKPDLLRMNGATASLNLPPWQYSTTIVVPTSQTNAQTWQYTTNTPPTNWYAANFDASAWSTGPGGFGTVGTPGAVVRTTWNTSDIWLRRTFNPGALTTQQLTNLILVVHHDEDVQIYVNGVAAGSASGYVTIYRFLNMTAQGQAAVVPNATNTLAVHCHQTGGGQYIDVGIDSRILLLSPPLPTLPAWVENGNGLQGQYYNGTNLSALALTRIDTQVNFNWAGASPDPALSNGVYSARWTGQVQPRYSEVYTFHLTADKGCRLWVNNQLIIDRWSAPPRADYAGSIPLTGGQRYDIRAEYFNNSDPGSIVLEWNSSSQGREVVPQGVLFAGTNGPGFPSATNLPPTSIVTNRAPLFATPFAPLPLGSVRPQGWLLKQCQFQRDGLTGNAETLYAADLGTNSAWLGGTGENWERGPYYFKGLVSLAYVMNDAGLKQKAQKWMDWLLNHQGPDGYIGPVSNNDWWPRMPATYALRDYYEATADPRVPTVLSNYFRYMLANLPGRPLSDWGKARAGDEMDVALWLYNRNGDTNLLTLVNLLHQQAYDWAGIYTSNNFMLYGTDFHPKHNVNVEQALKLPPVYYQLSKQPADRNALGLGLTNLMREHALSCGINSGTELLAGGASVQGIELDGIVEAMLSLETAERIIGDPVLADRLETISFNALPAGLANHIKGIQYYTLANNVIAINGGHGFNQDYANGTLPGPNSGYPCCRFNFHMGWPKYVQNSWAATPDGGLALLAYGPTVVNALVAGGQQVQVSEDTGYPFEEQARIQVLVSNAVSFPLSLRIPGWCSNATVTLNGQALSGQPAPVAGTFYRISRTWTNGDLVVVNLPMPSQTRPGPGNSVSVSRGPVVYSLRIGENWTVSTPDPLGLGFDEFNIHSTTPWAYALQIDPNNPAAALVVSNLPTPPDPFDPAQPSVSLLAGARQIPNWSIGWLGTHAFEPPASPVATGNPLETVTLVPFGSQHMRISWFPYLGIPSPTVGSFAENFDPTWSERWTVFGGNWSARNGVLSTVPGSGGGAKALAMETAFTNFTYEGDVQVGPAGNAGLIFRVSKPDIGADAYCGYYAGISAETDQFIFGYASNGWHSVANVPMTIAANTFYHLKVQASGSSLTFFVSDTNTAVLTTQDSRFGSGMLGVRDFCGDGNQSLSGFANLLAVESGSTVTNLPAPSGLLHRWSFNVDGSDSVGGANAALAGSTSISGGALQLPGGGPFANYAYVNIGNTLNTNASLTVETWFTISQLQSWSKVWMFGNDAGGEPLLSYINLTPRAGNISPAPYVPFIDFNSANGNEFSTRGYNTPSPALLTTNQEYYTAAVFDADLNTMSLYINGAFVASASMGGGNITQLMPNTMRFGAGYHFADPDFSGSIDELRIWSGALGTNAIMRNYLAGPDVLVVPPQITTQPQSQVVMAGSNATFSVAAAGTAPLGYQWRFQGTNLPGATATNLTISSVLPANAGPYSVVVTNVVGSVTSSVATLTVTVPRPLVSSFSMISGPAFRLSGTGVVGQAYVLQSATNLAPTIQWRSLATNVTSANGLFQFIDPQVTNYPRRFYRVATP